MSEPTPDPHEANKHGHTHSEHASHSHRGPHHGHAHGHHHGHAHEATGVKTRYLFIVIGLNLLITVVELSSGLYARSLSLVTDSLHSFSDAASLVISFVAIRIAEREQDYFRTFGYKRAGILAALLNALTLMATTIFLMKEAYFRFVAPEPIKGWVVVWVGSFGFFANALGAFLLKKFSHGDMNVRTAYLHLLSDQLASVAVVLGGILILLFRITWVDPLLTFLIALYIFKESLDVLKEAINILMQGVPPHLSVKDVVGSVAAQEGVRDVHHVHVWSLNENNVHFEARIVVDDILVSETAPISNKIQQTLQDEHNITHVTLQFEAQKPPTQPETHT